MYVLDVCVEFQKVPHRISYPDMKDDVLKNVECSN